MWNCLSAAPCPRAAGTARRRTMSGPASLPSLPFPPGPGSAAAAAGPESCPGGLFPAGTGDGRRSAALSALPLSVYKLHSQLRHSRGNRTPAAKLHLTTCIYHQRLQQLLRYQVPSVPPPPSKTRSNPTRRVTRRVYLSRSCSA